MSDVTPVEERFDHEEAKRIAERMLSDNAGMSTDDAWYELEKAMQLARAYLALLTEQSAYRDALRLRVANDPMWREGLTDEQSAALTTPESPTEGVGAAWRRNIEDTFPPVEAEEEG